MATFETLLSPSLDLSEMKQLGITSTRRVQVNTESGTSYALSGTATQDIFFSLPAGAKNEMINGANSYITFDVDFVSTGQVGFSNGDANAVFRSLETINNGTVVEQIDRYNVLSACFADFQSVSKARNLNSIIQGGALQSASSSKQPVEFANGGYTRVALPIYSAFYGVLCSQYSLSTDGIRQRWTLEAPNTALVSGDGGTLGYTISNISLMMEYVSVDSAVMEELANQAGRVMKTHGIGVANFNTTLTAQSTANSILIPCRKSAVKHIWSVLRRSDNLTASNRNSTGGRLFPNLRQYYYTIAGRQYPQIPVRTANSSATKFAGGEAMAEMLKTFRNLHANNADTVFDSTMYLDNVGQLESSAFILGYDFEVDADPKTITGIDTNSSNIYLQLDSATTSVGSPTASIGVPVASTLDTFCFYDVILTTNIDTGAISVIQ
jgi:hypothetical protein